jgi:hypothetical protein
MGLLQSSLNKVMNNKNYIILCVAAFITGLLLFAYHKEYIIFNFHRKLNNESFQASVQKQTIPIHFWHQNEWHSDQVSLLFSDDSTANMQQLVSRWVQLLNEEKIIKKKVALESVAITFDKQELIISFDKIPWNKEWNTYDKWMTVEGLLKTVKEVDRSIKKVRFLVNQQLLQDIHLDFTNPWPIEGFIN